MVTCEAPVREVTIFLLNAKKKEPYGSSFLSFFSVTILQSMMHIMSNDSISAEAK